MKSWIVDDDIKSDPKLAATIESLRPSLEKSLTPRFVPRTSVRWSLAPGGVNLWLADEAYPEGVAAYLPADDMAIKSEADHLVRMALSDLMAATSRALLDGIWAELEAVDG